MACFASVGGQGRQPQRLGTGADVWRAQPRVERRSPGAYGSPRLMLVPSRPHRVRPHSGGAHHVATIPHPHLDPRPDRAQTAAAAAGRRPTTRARRSGRVGALDATCQAAESLLGGFEMSSRTSQRGPAPLGACQTADGSVMIKRSKRPAAPHDELHW